MAKNKTKYIHEVSAKTTEFLDKWKKVMRTSTLKPEVVEFRRDFNKLKGDYMRSFDDEERAQEILLEMDVMIEELGEM